MTFYVARHLHHDGTPYKRPFAAFPHAAAARRWLEGRDDARVMFTPPLPPPSPCCACCVAAAERGELDHTVGQDCPYLPCDYHGQGV